MVEGEAVRASSCRGLSCCTSALDVGGGTGVVVDVGLKAAWNATRKARQVSPGSAAAAA